MATRKKVAVTDVEEPEAVEGEELSGLAAEVAVAADAEPCQHPRSYGVCFFGQIAEPCGVACQWAMDRGGAGR